MKRKMLTVLLVVCMALFALVGLTACDEKATATKPQKLSAPVVALASGWNESVTYTGEGK